LSQVNKKEMWQAARTDNSHQAGHLKTERQTDVDKNLRLYMIQHQRYFSNYN